MKTSALKLTLAYAIAAVIQGALSSRIPQDFMPDLALIVIVFIGLRLPMMQGILACAAFGLVSDVLFTQSIGLSLGGYTVVFLFTKIVSALFFADNALSRIILVILSGFLIKLYYAFALAVVGLELTIKIYPFAILLSGALAPWLVKMLESWTLRNEA